MLKNYKKKEQVQVGFSLMEVIVSLAIIMLLLLGVYSLIIFTLRINSDNQNYVIAMNLANKKMEDIRNLPYDDVGTLTGSPVGTIPENLSEGIFNIHTTVMFYDDPYDGTLASGTDSIFVDYKIVTVEVSWTGRFAPKVITIFSKVIPDTEETLSGYGLLKLLIVNSNGAPVSGADIHIENSSPPLNASYSSDGEGILRLPLLPDIEGYKISVTKPGFSTDQTHDRDLANPNPTKPNISIFEGVKTDESLTIDSLGVLTIRTVSNTLPDNLQVNTEIGSTTDTLVKFDIDSSDNLYFAWQSQTSTSTAINIQKFDSSLNKQYTSNKTISSTNHQLAPDIAVTSSGKAFVVWQDNSSVLKLIARNKQKQKLAKAKPRPYSMLYSYQPQNIFSSPQILQNSYNYLNNFKNIWQKNANDLVFNLKNNFKIFKAQAQTSASIVQSAISPNVNYNTLMSANLSSTPSVGNILLAVAVTRNHLTNFNDPSNVNGPFTEIVYSDAGGEYLEIGMWYKVVEASEPTQTNISATKNIRGGTLILMEISGIDLTDIVDTVIANNQTSNNGTTANTGTSAVTSENSFAIAALSFADNNFNTPNSSNYSSISSNTWTHELWEDWHAGRDGSLAIASMDINSAATQRATLSLSGGGGEERNSCMVTFNLAPVDNATLSSINTQSATMLIPSTDNYLGGTFVLTENSSSRNIESITVTENGSTDAQNNIDNFRLFYDLDTTAPYDCASESFSITDAQFGTSSTFDASDGKATLTESPGIEITTTKTMCLYPVFDINSNAAKHETIDLYVANPSADIVSNTGTIIPASAITVASTTELLKPAEINQSGSRWRNDDSDEVNASWQSNENTAISISKNDLVRLRFGIYNSGSLDTGPVQYELEYGQKITSCDNISTWNTVPSDASLHWQITNSANISDGATTSNVMGGITDMNIDFVEGYTKDTSALTAAIDLDDTSFTEIEYALQATNNATDGSYCFRLTNNGSTANFVYTNYPQATIVGDDNIYITSLDSSGNADWTVKPIKKVNTDMSDFAQASPRLAISENFGTATTCIVWEDYRNGQADIYAQSFSADGTKLWGSDLQITSSSTDETDPVIAIDREDNIYISWSNQDPLSKDIYLQKIDFDANILLTNPQRITSSSSDDTEIDLLIGNNGNPYIAWTSDTSGLKNIYFSKISSSTYTSLWTKKINNDQSSDDRSKVSLAINSSNIYATWTDFREGNNDIYSQKYDLNGVPQWANDQKINVNTGWSNQSVSQTIIDSNQNPIAVWQDNRINTLDIFMTIFNDPGATVGVANVPLIITGTKRIGENPVILKFKDYQTSNATGYVNIAAEWDVPGYSIDINPASSSLSIIMRNPIQPINFLAGDTKNVLIYVE